ncbi:TetR/AcrR family transcriptional regulator [Streptomyces sp. MMG1121]|uniref:TetR/AcrR family transcriptional regulator n=1 Tax=Streptomyces sp. MMG1121 TaxID=1415544 RepID=UPI000B274DE6|nr:TetR/AcrR family transcriptional regulator [Streptomyces sp. MMG1121]
MLTFWAQGYEGTSISDLTAAMGMSAPSIYGAFGDKETLFKRVVERYLAGPGGYLEKSLDQPTAAALVRTLLNAAIDTIAGDHTPHGCLTVHGALAVGPRSQPAQQVLARIGRNKVQLLTDRLQEFHDCGDLPAHCDPSALAQLLITVIQGLAVQAASGAPREALHRIADQMTALLPH